MMIKNAFKLLLVSFLIASCDEEVRVDKPTFQKTENVIYDSLKERALQNLDSTKWDVDLYKQDIEIYNRFPEVFDGFPITKSPFPVATYDYAVSSIPVKIELEDRVLKGVRIGEFENPNSDKVIDRLTLFILTDNNYAEDKILVESRNYPYLTAQGTFHETHSKFDWVFVATPDGFSSLIVNMKLFDLRFGETVIIYPQTDNSFEYDQIEMSPNNFGDINSFKKEVLNNLLVKS